MKDKIFMLDNQCSKCGNELFNPLNKHRGKKENKYIIINEDKKATTK